MFAIFVLLIVTNNLLIALAVKPYTLNQLLVEAITCKAHQMNLQKCIPCSVESIKPALIAGIPELKIPSIEPYFTERVDLLTTDTIIPRLLLTDIYLDGTSNFTINKVKVNSNLRWINIHAHFPNIQLTALYEIHNKSLPNFEDSKHRMTGNFDDVRANINIEGEFYWNEKQLICFKATFVSVKLNTDKKCQIFTEHGRNNSAIYLYLSEYWNKRYLEILFEVEKLASAFIKKTANKLYPHFPFALAPK